MIPRRAGGATAETMARQMGSAPPRKNPVSSRMANMVSPSCTKPDASSKTPNPAEVISTTARLPKRVARTGKRTSPIDWPIRLAEKIVPNCGGVSASAAAICGATGPRIECTSPSSR